MRNHRRTAMVVVLGLVIAACGGDSAEEGTTTTASSDTTQVTETTQPTDTTQPAETTTTGAPSEPVTIQLAFPTGRTSFANCDVGVGIDQGFFAEEGIELATENLGSGVRVVQALIGGDFDIGGASIEPVINAVAQGGEFSIIGTYADRLTVSMVVPPDIEAVEDLAGQILGIQDIGAFREVMTRMVLESAGMTADDVQYRGVETTAYIPSLVAGQIQSAILHAEQVESILTQDPDFHVLLDLYEVEPDYHYGTYFVSNEWLGENQDVAQRYVNALLESHRFMYENRDETVRICSEVTGFEESVVDAAYTKYFETNCVFPVESGLDDERISYTIDRMEQLGTLAEGEKPDPSSFVNHDLMDQATAEAGEMGDRGC